MQPDQPSPFPQNGGHDPFDFIMKDQPKAKRSLLPGGSSAKSRILVVVGGLVILTLLFVVVMALLTSSGTNNKKALIGLAQEQTEIIRLSKAARDTSRSTAVQNYAQSTYAVFNTSQAQTLAYLRTQKIKISSKQLVLGRSVQDDASLTSAGQAGRYDDEYIKIINQDLLEYQAKAKATYQTAKGQKEKLLLKTLFEQVTNLTKNQPTSS